MSPRKRMSRPRKGYINRAKSSRLLRKTVIVASVALVLAVLSGVLLFGARWLNAPPPGPKTAAIVDQLSLTVPNPDFVTSATSLLKEAGYLVDYYPGEQVTVDFYRDLPTLDYDFIILRVHSALSRKVDTTTGEVVGRGFVGMFTGEPFSNKYREESRKGLVGPGFTDEGSPPVVTIGAEFVEERMKGRFDNTVIIMMGCEGLSVQSTAQAFLDKGAKVFVGWNQLVSADHTDNATHRLLEKLLQEAVSVREAVAQTAAEVGSDP